MLSVADAADRLGIQTQHLYRLIRSGRVPSSIDAGLMVVDLDAAHAALAKGWTVGEHDTAPDVGEPMHTVPEVAEILRCSKETVRRLIRQRKLAAFRFPGSRSHIRVPRYAVNEFVAEHCDGDAIAA